MEKLVPVSCNMKLVIKKSLSITTPLTCLGHSTNKETRKFEVTTPTRIESNHNTYGLNRNYAEK